MKVMDICLQSNGSVHSLTAHSGSSFVFKTAIGDAFIRIQDTVANPVMLDAGGFSVVGIVFPVEDVPYVHIPTLPDGSSPLDYSSLGSTKADVISALFDRYLNA